MSFRPTVKKHLRVITVPDYSKLKDVGTMTLGHVPKGSTIIGTWFNHKKDELHITYWIEEPTRSPNTAP